MQDNAEMSYQNDVFLVTGKLNYRTVNGINAHAQILFKQTDIICIDFSNVTLCDSAALAVIIEWVKYAKQHNKKLSLKNFPSHLMIIAMAADLNEILQPYII